MTHSAPLLELDALAPDRPKVLIRSQLHPNGKLYELTTAEDLSIETQTELANRGQRLETMTQDIGSRLPTEEEGRELQLLIDKMVPLILADLEDEVMAALTTDKKLQIIKVFTSASSTPGGEQASPTSPTTTIPAPPTSEN